MAGKKTRDLRRGAARYQLDGSAPQTEDEVKDADADADNVGQQRMEQRAQYVELVIQQAIRRGDFDNLPGAGKPLRDLQQTHDPDWWIRQKIEREKITGLGPPALTLRTEDASLDARLDSAGSETAVRDILADFNKRVVEARRQLQGGPPVVTLTRNVEAEVAAWRQRRAARHREAEQARLRQDEARARLTWRERRRV